VIYPDVDLSTTVLGYLAMVSSRLTVSQHRGRRHGASPPDR
jgi:hypothetical protein